MHASIFPKDVMLVLGMKDQLLLCLPDLSGQTRPGATTDWSRQLVASDPQFVAFMMKRAKSVHFQSVSHACLALIWAIYSVPEHNRIELLYFPKEETFTPPNKQYVAPYGVSVTQGAALIFVFFCEYCEV